MLKSYLTRLQEVTEHGDAREESFYSALEDLLEEYATTTKKKDIHITTLPKKN